ncbi:hypothetical protein M413DRAFT_449491, partial [Hebeloma cylindrosporum]
MSVKGYYDGCERLNFVHIPSSLFFADVDPHTLSKSDRMRSFVSCRWVSALVILIILCWDLFYSITTRRVSKRLAFWIWFGAFFIHMGTRVWELCVVLFYLRMNPCRSYLSQLTTPSSPAKAWCGDSVSKRLRFGV